MAHIFISYSHKDSGYAHRLAKELEQKGFSVWIDDRIDYGTQWPRVIQEHLDDCSAFVVIMTPRSYQSDWVQNELSRAKRKGKKVFPLLLEGEEPWLSVEVTQYVDVRDSGLPPERFYRELAKVLGVRVMSPEPARLPRQVPLRVTVPEVVPPTVMERVKPFEPEMVLIPAGEFLYGFLYGDEKKKVTLPEFWIDKTPVTNAEYARFVADTGHEPPRHWKGKTPPQKIADHPVTYVSWHDAVAYAEWAGKRLPTEEEWEKAARGSDGRVYPWGDGFDKNRCNTKESGIGKTTPVGQYSPQGDSPYGCVDMAGNVWEWTASDYDKNRKVVRGGSWGYLQQDARCSARNGGNPRGRFYGRGFRCARGSL
jgi:formylglycine-generating enzyme required for sulfatase activity